MSKRKIPVIRIELFDFDRIVRMSDEQVHQHLVFVCRQSTKRIIPPKVRHDAFRVSRAANSVTIRLLLSAEETARVSFVRAPNVNIVR